MSIATLASAARQSLARGLEALQAADAPPALLTVAQPLVKAMRVLFEIEASPAPARAAAAPALDALRESLRLLQLPEHFQYPAAERGMAAVAEALGVVVDIAKRLDVASKAAAPGRMHAEALAATSLAREAPVPEAAAPRAAPKAPAAAAAVPAQAVARAPAAAAAAAPKRAAAPVEPVRMASDDAALRPVEAALGAHSATNFYKGLAGGDIVASGGLFIATYQVPEVGQKLLLKVSMPGGYEFEAKGVVAWTREVRLNATAPEASPGFGAQFSEITDEGRGLIQRYVRNREPLFHDDL